MRTVYFLANGKANKIDVGDTTNMTERNIETLRKTAAEHGAVVWIVHNNTPQE